MTKVQHTALTAIQPTNGVNHAIEVVQLLDKLTNMITDAGLKSLSSVENKLRDAKSKIILWTAYGDNYKHMQQLLPRHGDSQANGSPKAFENDTLVFISSIESLISNATCSDMQPVADILANAKQEIALWAANAQEYHPMHEKFIHGMKHALGVDNHSIYPLPNTTERPVNIAPLSARDTLAYVHMEEVARMKVGLYLQYMAYGAIVFFAFSYYLCL